MFRKKKKPFGLIIPLFSSTVQNFTIFIIIYIIRNRFFVLAGIVSETFFLGAWYAEELLQPSFNQRGKGVSGIHDISLQTRCDDDIRKNLYANSMSSGGTVFSKGLVSACLRN